MTIGRLGIILAAWAIGAVYSAQSQGPLPEAPSGFDDEGIEVGLAEQHKQDKATFDTVDEKTPDGLGPIYNAQSCRECHQNPVSGAGSQITELRVGHRGSKGEFVFPEVPIVGDTIKGRTLINDRAICVEAQEHVPPGNEIRTKRLSLSIVGDGFVEAISDSSILAVRNRQCDMNMPKSPGTAAICGIAQFVEILEKPGVNNQRLGRFGWKNQHASLLSFAADAYLNEMGITNRLQPDEFTKVCNPPVADKNDDTHVTEPNDSEDDITAFTRFMRATKVPPRVFSASDRTAIDSGADIFRRVGCAVCHVESFETVAPGTRLIDAGNDSFEVTEALGSKTIHPFSDFLLHDVGTGDGIALAPAEHYGPAVARRVLKDDAERLRGRLSASALDAVLAGGNSQEGTGTPAVPPPVLDLDQTLNPERLRPLRDGDECDPRHLATISTPQQSDLYRIIQCATNRLRTPPLWGIHQRSRFMHDGDSVRIEDAIGRHKGEAAGVTQNFERLSETERRHLLLFVGSL